MEYKIFTVQFVARIRLTFKCSHKLITIEIQVFVRESKRQLEARRMQLIMSAVLQIVKNRKFRAFVL